MAVRFNRIRSYNQVARHYAKYADIDIEVGNRLLTRLSYLKIDPQYVLDLGGGNGYFAKKLKKCYPKAHIINLDAARMMLLEAKAQQGIFKKFHNVQGDMHHMPFANESFDLIFANQTLHLTDDLTALLQELSRILKPNGCLMFSTLGPDTGLEIKTAWSMVDSFDHVNHHIDMHDYGDALVKERFQVPVVDMEPLTIHYRSFEALITSLKRQGNLLCHPNQRKGLTPPAKWHAFREAYQRHQTPTHDYPLTYEIIYGQAWRGTLRNTAKGHEATISIESLKASRPLKPDPNG